MAGLSNGRYKASKPLILAEMLAYAAVLAVFLYYFLPLGLR